MRIHDFDTAQPPPYPPEALLITALPEMAGRRAICMSPGLAQFAAALAQALPHAVVSCTYLDLYRASLALGYWHNRPENLHVECAADLPEKEADMIALPLSAGGEAELSRELLQSGHQRLRIGGKLYAATDNPRDTWLAAELRKLFDKVERRPAVSGALYIAKKTAPLRKVKDFTCQFAFRDRGRLIRAVSRPGVFSHRHVDPGVRRLMAAMQIEPGEKVLDIGCGAGVIALAAACAAEGVAVHAVDSSARAIECTARGAQLNQLTNVTTELNASGDYRNAGSYDLALANPPYYSGFRIARHFLTAGHFALRPGGKLLVVTKSPAWYEEHLTQTFDQVSASENKGYFVLAATRPGR